MERGKFRDSLIFEVLFWTGLRASEFLSMQVRDVVTGEKSKIRVKNSKTESGIRDALIPRKLAQKLKLYANTNGKKKYDRIFDMTTRNLQYIIKKWGRRIIGKDIHPHTLRHSFAVYYLNETGNLMKLKQLLGHRNITSTQKYLRYTIEDVRDEYEELFRNSQ